jgi:hypothetical protein
MLSAACKPVALWTIMKGRIQFVSVLWSHWNFSIVTEAKVENSSHKNHMARRIICVFSVFPNNRSGRRVTSMGEGLFERISTIAAPIEKVFRWHARLGAIERYSPPWDPISVVRRSGGIETGAEVVIRMKAGPIPYLWHALHTEYEENRLFRDKQLRGPFLKWIHTHRFEPNGKDTCILKDSIEYKLLPHPLRKTLSYRLIAKKLGSIFAYRHKVLQQDLNTQLRFPNSQSLKILISGSSGLIGSNLVPFLTTAGHRVLRLVRRKPVNSEEVFWDPDLGILDVSGLNGIDAVIHLAGENIGEGRWSDEKKERIITSRINGTRLLVDTISKLAAPPKVLLSASAIGFYGNRGDRELRETDKAGPDFISKVCREWEAESFRAQQSGIRTVLLRIGVVVDPRGGALARLLPLYRVGIGTSIAPGNQYISWIGMNDTIDAIYFLLNTPTLYGPVNLVTPDPVSSDHFYHTLAAVSQGGLQIKIPESVIKLAFGQKGEEVLLASTRVKPEILMAAGFTFRYDTLKPLLTHILGQET